MTYWNLHKKFELPMTNVHRDLTFQSWVFLIGGEPNNCSALVLSYLNMGMIEKKLEVLFGFVDTENLVLQEVVEITY